MGTLYVVATPIGNLGDLTLRALETLKSVDLIVCEDTRQAKKLLDHFEIKKPLESLHEHNEVGKTPKLIEILKNDQDLALVSDAGTPLLSDPGFRLVQAAIKAGIKVVPIPGPSAITAALSVSGLPLDQFVYVGFLPQKQGQRRNFLEVLKNEERTIVVFESPNRLVFSLQDILEILGDRPICVAREMTKIHEEFFRGKVSQAIARFENSRVKGEITLVIGRE